MQKLKQDLYIGSNLRSFRMKAGLTQEQVTAKLQVMGIQISRPIYAQIESGTYSIKISVLIGLKKIYNVTYDEIFDGIDI